MSKRKAKPASGTQVPLVNDMIHESYDGHLNIAHQLARARSHAGVAASKNAKPASPEALLREAVQVPDPEPYIALHEYGATLCLLLDKKRMTYKEIQAWLAERGLDYSTAHISNALQKWRALHPRGEDDGKQR